MTTTVSCHTKPSLVCIHTSCEWWKSCIGNANESAMSHYNVKVVHSCTQFNNAQTQFIIMKAIIIIIIIKILFILSLIEFLLKPLIPLFVVFWAGYGWKGKNSTCDMGQEVKVQIHLLTINSQEIINFIPGMEMWQFQWKNYFFFFCDLIFWLTILHSSTKKCMQSYERKNWIFIKLNEKLKWILIHIPNGRLQHHWVKSFQWKFFHEKDKNIQLEWIANWIMTFRMEWWLAIDKSQL